MDINPIAQQATLVPQGTAVADILMTSPPIGGLEYRLRRLPERAFNWVIRKTLAVFLALTAGAAITLLYPDAPWVRLAEAAIAVYKEHR